MDRYRARRVGVVVAAAGVGLLTAGAWAPVVAAAPPGLEVTVTPCAPVSGSAVCSADPATLTATWPATIGLSGPVVGGVTVSWTATGRPAAAPAPARTAVGLSTSTGRCSTSPGLQSSTTCTWSWPSEMLSPSGGQFLNGTYTVTACANDPAAASSTQSTAAPSCNASGLAPASIAVGVTPPAPANLTLSGSSLLTLHWSPVPVVDLAGYRVARDGSPIYTCSANGAPGAVSACPSPPVVTDSPGAGRHTYRVTALRYGPSAGAPFVESPPSVALATVASPAPGSGGSASGGGGSGGSGSGGSASASSGAGSIVLPPVPYFGPTPTLPTSRPPASRRPGSATAPAADTGFGSTLPYGARAPGGNAGQALPLASQATATTTRARAGASTATVHRAALFALGMLILAVAAHLIYLKGEIARREALFRALRHAAGVIPPPTTGNRGR